MRNLKMTVSYLGTRYSGFQIQPNRPTVQGALEAAIERLTGERVKVYGSGRTDAGVHARAQVINFHTASRIPAERWSLAMNSRLPDDIVVTAAEEVPEDFHARRSAIRKTYRYSIQYSRFPDVFHRHTRFHHPAPLDLEAMREALELLEGEHDFTSFCSAQTAVESRVRTIYETKLVFEPEPQEGGKGSFRGKEEGVIHIYVTGNGFLYNMVRIIVGTVLEVGEGKRKPGDLTAILAARDRSRSGPTAMAHGLTLWDVQY